MTAFDHLCIAGKNRIAIDAIQIARRHVPDEHISVICNAGDDGEDQWQPSLRRFAKAEGLPIVALADAEARENILFLSVEFDRIVQTRRFAPSSALVNIHFSALPAYKGMYTSCLPILHGAATSGCTLHAIDDGIDTGPVIAQTRFALAPDETAKTLYARYLDAGARLIAETMPAILARDYAVHAQPAAGSTYYPKAAIDYARLTVDLRVTGEQLNRQVRAFNHRSYQLPSVHGRAISRCDVLPARSTERPGKILFRDEAATRIATIDFDCLLVHDRFDEAEEAVMQDNADRLAPLLARDPALATETSVRGWSLLARATYNGRHSVLAVLIAHMADLDVANGKGTTPLMYAKDRLLLVNDPVPASMLLAAGADPAKRDYCGKTVVDYMAGNDRLRFEALIRDAK